MAPWLDHCVTIAAIWSSDSMWNNHLSPSERKYLRQSMMMGLPLVQIRLRGSHHSWRLFQSWKKNPSARSPLLQPLESLGDVHLRKVEDSHQWRFLQNLGGPNLLRPPSKKPITYPTWGIGTWDLGNSFGMIQVASWLRSTYGNYTIHNLPCC